MVEIYTTTVRGINGDKIMFDDIMDFERGEYRKRDRELDLIASQNLCSEKILEACGSIAQMKYAEGFPGKRYYAGCEVVDLIERTCENEVLKLFKAEKDYLANVQPANGSSANIVAYRALLNFNDVVLAPAVDHGGHISHSHDLSFISQYHKVITYGVDENGYIDYEEMEKIALRSKPTLIIVGMSNYSREIDYKRIRHIARQIDAYVLADIAHISGLIATGLHQSPVGYADIITSTTHKILRGPRSAFMLYTKELEKKVKRAQIPGCFGGPDEAKILAKLICFKEAQTPEYLTYCQRVLNNAKVMVDTFVKYGIPVLTGGTDNHSFCLDLRDSEYSGKEVADALATARVITNCNSIPKDTRSFMQTSGLRIGTPSITTRGLDSEDCQTLALSIIAYLHALRDDETRRADAALQAIEDFVMDCTERYPLKNIYPNKFCKLYS